MTLIVQNYKRFFKHLGQFGLKFNSDLGKLGPNLGLDPDQVRPKISTLVNSDHIFKKALVNSYLVFMGSELTSGRGPN